MLMGLDIYLYRIKKNEDIKEGKRYNMQKLRNVYPNLHVLDSREMESICDTIKNMAVKVIGVERVFSPQLVGEFAGIDNVEYIHTCVECRDYRVFNLYDKDEKDIGQVKIDANSYDKVLIDKDFEYLVVDMEEVDYQRKGLNDEGWSLMPENCVYDDDKERVEKMCERGGLSDTFLDNWVDGETVLWCWW